MILGSYNRNPCEENPLTTIFFDNPSPRQMEVLKSLVNKFIRAIGWPVEDIKDIASRRCSNKD